jgi:hypothetical protein
MLHRSFDLDQIQLEYYRVLHIIVTVGPSARTIVGRNVAAPKKHQRPVSRRHADHEVAGGARDLERDVHDVARRHHLERAGTDPEQSRHQSRKGNTPRLYIRSSI